MILRIDTPTKRTNERSVLRTAFCLLLVSWQAAAEGHNPLLPRPQEVRYGGGQLPVHGLAIVFGSPPTSEDQFATRELSSAHTAVPVATERNSSPSIQLNRTGSAADLAQPGEKPEPDSSEAHSIRVGAS